MTQHKPVVFVVRMQKKKRTKTMGRRRKNGKSTKRPLWDLQRSYVEEHRERAECNQ